MRSGLRSAHGASYRIVVIVAAIGALLSTILGIATAAPRTVVYTAEEIGDRADGFWALEINGDRAYRWTDGAARVRLPALNGSTLLAVAVTLSAPQRLDAASVPAMVTTGAETPLYFDVAPEWRTYRLLIDASASDHRIPDLHITTAAWRAPRDDRDLGILVNRLTAYRLLPSHHIVVAERFLFLASLAALMMLITRYARLTRLVPVAVTISLAGLALYAPVQLAQWLPVNWSMIIGLALIAVLIESLRRSPPGFLMVIRRAGVVIMLALAWTATSMTHILTDRLGNEALKPFLVIFALVALYSALAYALLRAVILRLRQFGRRAQVFWLISALLLGAGATLVIPTFPPPFWFVEEVIITPLDRRNPASQGSDVQLVRAENGGQVLPPGAFVHNGGWVRRNSSELIAPGGVTEPLRWQGLVRGAVTLELLAHPQAGRVRVQYGDQVRDLDLYAETVRYRTLTLAPRSINIRFMQGILWLADIVSFGTLLTSALLLLATWQPQTRLSVLAWGWYTLPCLITWSLSLLVFYPGLMSTDSVDQWGQMLRGRYHDYHPAFHSLTMWLITRVWLSPAAVALAQIGALALACGLILRELALLGVNRWMQAFLAILFALSPVNNLMVITLWKDIPYTIALLFVFWMLLRVWRTDGAWLRSWRALAAIGAALAALALYRHNGAPTALLILPAFLLAGRQARWRQIAVIGGIALALALVVKVGVYRVLDVLPAPPWFARQMQIHQLGAFVVHSEHLDDSDRALLEQLLPLDQWRNYYSCYGPSPLLYSDPWRAGEVFNARVREFTALWRRLALRDPATLVRHQACLTTLIWRVTQPDDGYLDTWNSELIWKGGRDLGLAPASVFPEVRDEVMRQLRLLERPEVIWLVWRPALHLYLTLFCVAAASVRRRSWRMAALALPVAAQSSVWMLLLTVQNFRFQYPVYVISVLALGLLALPASEIRERLQEVQKKPTC
ncbi:MAG: DUF6020 family protein [Roseiflexus sp.]|nr:DUF6020 family protein [Roseiflexus sp.]